MKSYTICKVNGAPDWSKIPSVTMDTAYKGSERFPISAKAQLCWDEEGIFVHLSTVEDNIRCTYTGVTDPVCQDSCLEFFFSPTEAPTYFNIEFNPNCSMYLGYGNCIDDLIRLVFEGENKFAPKANRTEDGWEIFYKVPFSFIRHFFPAFKAYEGLHFRGNFYKCGDLTPNRHYYSWSPIVGGNFRFHRPDCYGELILGGEL